MLDNVSEQRIREGGRNGTLIPAETFHLRDDCLNRIILRQTSVIAMWLTLTWTEFQSQSKRIQHRLSKTPDQEDLFSEQLLEIEERQIWLVQANQN